jgi:hypothetical protein
MAFKVGAATPASTVISRESRIKDPTTTLAGGFVHVADADRQDHRAEELLGGFGSGDGLGDF